MDDNQNYADEYQEGAQQYQEGEGYQEYADEGYQGENFDEMGAVVSDVPVPLVVELGRVECNARDIMYLRVGQVMDLRRSPYDYLDLVVNGQPLGKGELVEIEGQLGIRIIELSK